MNLEIFRQQLIDVINSCGLPPGAAYYVLKDVLRELEAVYINDINSPQEEEIISEEPVFDIEEETEEPFTAEIICDRIIDGKNIEEQKEE